MNHEEDKGHEGLDARIKAVGRDVVDAGLKVHRTLGAGLLESAYETCLAFELESRGLRVARQSSLPVVYEGRRLDDGCRLDLLVEDSVIVEVKAVEALSRLHEAQIITYLRLSNLRLGYLLNFNVPLFRNGLRRIVL